MTAKEMFEKAGRNEQITEYVFYASDIDYVDEDGFTNIYFDLEDKKVKFVNIDEEELTDLEKRAIKKKKEELGWE